MGLSKMIKMEIKIDENKVDSDQIYSVESIYRALDQIFLRFDIRKDQGPDGTIWYSGNRNRRNSGLFENIIAGLRDKEWFIDYIVKWMLYSSDDSDGDFDFEDLLYPRNSNREKEPDEDEEKILLGEEQE